MAECHICSHWGCERAHTGPYKLLRGGWSDGVDRVKPIADQLWCDETPERVYVFQYHNAFHDEFMWAVVRTEPYVDQDFHTHDEAIAYADHHARTTKNGDA